MWNHREVTGAGFETEVASKHAAPSHRGRLTALVDSRAGDASPRQMHLECWTRFACNTGAVNPNFMR
jgi:hypothetical protein